MHDVLTGDAAVGALLARDALSDEDGGDAPTSLRRRIRGLWRDDHRTFPLDAVPECDVVRARAAVNADNLEAALLFAQSAQHGGLSPWSRAVAEIVAQYSRWRMARDTEVGSEPVRSISKDANIEAFQLCLLAMAATERLRLGQGRQLALEAMELDPQYPCARASASAMTALVLRDEGVLSLAWCERHLDWMADAEPIRLIEPLIVAHRLVAQVQHENGRGAQAITVLRQLEAIGEKRDVKRATAAARAELVPLHLAHGDVDAAKFEADRIQAVLGKSDQDILHATDKGGVYARALARIHVHERSTCQARVADAIQHHYDLARRRGRLRTALSYGVQLCLLDDLAGRTEESLVRLKTITKIVAATGSHQCILDDEVRLRPLFARMGTSLPLSDDIRGCLLWLDRRQRRGHRAVPAAPDALTSREQTIMTLLIKGLRNKEIARVVGVAPETVKSHLSNIFVKLQATTRAEAVSIAIAEGLVILNDVRGGAP